MAGALLLGLAGAARASGEGADGSPSTLSASRSGWSTVFTIEDDGLNRISGVAEARGRLFALGRSGPMQPMIWVSQDAASWSAAHVAPLAESLPESEESVLSGAMVDVEDAGDRLVALATLGLASGSGPVGTKIYVSEDDGQTWSAVESTPGTTAAAMFDLARLGDRLVAVGTAIWVSDDGGLSWTETVDFATLGGTLHAVDARGGLIVAAADGGNGDLAGPPALALVSSDGLSWERTVLHPDGGAHAVAIGGSGRIVVGGHSTGSDAMVWLSDDAGQSWDTVRPPVECCLSDLVATPASYLGAMSTVFEGALASPDGRTWTATAFGDGLEDVAWGPRFGLSGASENSILLGPTLGSGEAGGDITFRLILRGDVMDGDAFGLAIDASNGIAIERRVLCGPSGEDSDPQLVACRPGSHEVVEEAGDALPVGTVLTYGWTRTHANGDATVVFRDTVTVTLNAQVRTLVYDYNLGAQLPNTAIGPSVRMPTAFVGMVTVVVGLTVVSRKRLRRPIAG